MSCTTILAGKKATYDGSTMIARNDDSGAGSYTPKKLTIVLPEDQPRHYKSVLSHVEIDLPENPMRCSAVPNALPGEGIWAGAGVNATNVAMTATETIASNERVLGADPLVVYRPAEGDLPEQPGGIGEEDYPTIVLPYIRSAREGVLRTGALLEKYGTCEMNGIAFSDVNEIWWMETLGGHHWIARRVPDDQYVVMPNQSGIDCFDLEDALGEGRDYLCSADLAEFMADNHLCLEMEAGKTFNPRLAFGTHDDADHIYNTPRAWFMCRYLNPRSADWDGKGARDRRTGEPLLQYGPEDDDLPWSMVPERRITVEDVKYLLSSHFQGTPYDPYSGTGDAGMRGAYRCIGVNRTDFLALLQLRPYVPESVCAVEWLSFGSNVFNGFVPFYPNTGKVPAYLATTAAEVDTQSFYWASRLIGALSDAAYGSNRIHIERYQAAVLSQAHAILKKYDGEIAEIISQDQEITNRSADQAAEKTENKKVDELICRANEELAQMAQRETTAVLGKVLFEASNGMRNAFARSDA